MAQIEQRAGVAGDLKATGDDDQISVSGYAAVFDQEADIGGMFREVIRKGAFTDALKRNDDVVFLVNHGGLPLARTRSGTLKLTEDDKGLRIETDLDAGDPDVVQITRKMARNDLDRMSFQFRATKQEWDDTQEPPLRSILAVELYDVSIVNTPAYDGTDIALRSLDESRKAAKAEVNAGAARRRIRMKGNLSKRTLAR